MKVALSALFVVVLLTGCQSRSDQITYDGHYFRTKVSKVDKQRDTFVTEVRDVSKSFDGARAAALHKSVAYCVENYGNSDINWTVGPETPASQLRIIDNTLSYSGVCPQ